MARKSRTTAGICGFPGVPPSITVEHCVRVGVGSEGEKCVSPGWGPEGRSAVVVRLDYESLLVVHCETQRNEQEEVGETSIILGLITLSKSREDNTPRFEELLL